MGKSLAILVAQLGGSTIDDEKRWSLDASSLGFPGVRKRIVVDIRFDTLTFCSPEELAALGPIHAPGLGSAKDLLHLVHSEYGRLERELEVVEDKLTELGLSAVRTGAVAVSSTVSAGVRVRLSTNRFGVVRVEEVGNMPLQKQARLLGILQNYNKGTFHSALRNFVTDIQERRTEVTRTEPAQATGTRLLTDFPSESGSTTASRSSGRVPLEVSLEEHRIRNQPAPAAGENFQANPVERWIGPKTKSFVSSPRTSLISASVSGTGGNSTASTSQEDDSSTDVSRVEAKTGFGNTQWSDSAGAQISAEFFEGQEHTASLMNPLAYHESMSHLSAKLAKKDPQALPSSQVKEDEVEILLVGPNRPETMWKSPPVSAEMLPSLMPSPSSYQPTHSADPSTLVRESASLMSVGAQRLEKENPTERLADPKSISGPESPTWTGTTPDSDSVGISKRQTQIQDFSTSLFESADESSVATSLPPPATPHTDVAHSMPGCASPSPSFTHELQSLLDEERTYMDGLRSIRKKLVELHRRMERSPSVEPRVERTQIELSPMGHTDENYSDDFYSEGVSLSELRRAIVSGESGGGFSEEALSAVDDVFRSTPTSETFLSVALWVPESSARVRLSERLEQHVRSLQSFETYDGLLKAHQGGQFDAVVFVRPKRGQGFDRCLKSLRAKGAPRIMVLSRTSLDSNVQAVDLAVELPLKTKVAADTVITGLSELSKPRSRSPVR